MNVKAKSLILVTMATLLLAGPAVAQPKPQPKTKAPATTQQVRAGGLEAERPLTANIVQTMLPSDYPELQASFADVYGSSESIDQKRLATSKIMNEYRARFVDQVRNAPDELLKPVIQALVDLHVAVEAREETATCGEFTLNGTADLFNRQLAGPYAGELDAMSAAYLRAVAGGIESPTNAAKATPQDWNAVSQLVTSQGTPASYLDAIVAADPTDPAMCKGMIDLLQALVNMPGEEGHRLRAELAVSSSLY